MVTLSALQTARVLRLTDDALFAFSTQTRSVVFVSAAMEQVSGLTREQLEADPQSWLHNVHPDDISVASASAAWLVDSETQVRYRYLHPLRGERVFEARLSFIAEEQVVMGVVRDVTDAVEAERLRRAGLQRVEDFGALVAHLPVGIILSSGPRVLLANAAARSFFPALGKPTCGVSEALPPALAHFVGTNEAQCGAVTPSERPLRHFSFVVAPLELGGQRHTMWTVSDDTERVETQRRLESATSERHLLERSMLVSEVSAFVTHELAQPLAGITAWIEGSLARLSAETSPSTAAVTQALGSALDQCARAARLVARVRALIVRGEVNPEAVSLGSLFDRARRAAKGQRITLSGGADALAFVDPMYAEVGLVTVLRLFAGEEGATARASFEGPEVVLTFSTPRALSDVTDGPRSLEFAVAVAAFVAIGGQLRREGERLVVRLPSAAGVRLMSPSAQVSTQPAE